MNPAEGPDDPLLDESDPVQAEWDYPASKLAAEAVVAEQRHAIPAVILRIAGVYDDRGHCIPIVQQIRRIHEQVMESFVFPGNPDHGQAYVHRDDVAACFRAVVDERHRLDPHELFLSAEPELLTYREVQECIGELVHGREWPTIRIPAPLAKAGAWIKEKVPGLEAPFIKPCRLTIYQFDPDQQFSYCYAHLERYAPGLAEGQRGRDRSSAVTGPSA